MKSESLAPPTLVRFGAGSTGGWNIIKIDAVRGDTLPMASRLQVDDGSAGTGLSHTEWQLSGFASNIRYTNRSELDHLKRVQAPLGRPEARLAALIPIRKSMDWWLMPQDERRSILEERSRHIAIGMEYLPAVARKLLHSRDLGEPFDFLTWFEFAPEHETHFDELLKRLRASHEWHYVDREVEIRLHR